MITLLFLCSLLTLTPVVGQEDVVDPEDVVRKVLEIAQKEVITMSDFHEVMGLVNADPEKLEAELTENGILYLFKVDLLDAIFTDAFFESGDISILKEREKLCLWTQKNYPAGSREYKVAESRLVEIYTYWGKYRKASSLLEKNIMSCTYPSLDHAACMYTQAWMQQQMGNPDKARRIVQAALEEYQMLKEWAESAIANENLTTEQIQHFQTGLEETEHGISDVYHFLEEL